MSLPEVEKYIVHSIPVASIKPEMLVDIKIPPAPERKPRGGSSGRGRPGGRPASREAQGKSGSGKPRRRRRKKPTGGGDDGAGGGNG